MYTLEVQRKIVSGQGRIDRIFNLPYNIQMHNQTKVAYKYNIIALNNTLKRAAATSTDNIRHTFDGVTSSDQAGAMVTYKNIPNTMIKRRHLKLIRNPKQLKNLKT
ncbi:hypothetical protein LOD99_4795 [Oopsacas minuta]|uniref:Uncharacterized protein n=1 Tax=Oopsacas minuta TaxID=111878 RepID=A0AAV7JTD6_9METZ|nr:hypothetical protein LOD99_4795 [Oopsacas minuta]